jgi:hypothetical protein
LAVSLNIDMREIHPSGLTIRKYKLAFALFSSNRSIQTFNRHSWDGEIVLLEKEK